MLETLVSFVCTIIHVEFSNLALIVPMSCTNLSFSSAGGLLGSDIPTWAVLGQMMYSDAATDILRALWSLSSPNGTTSHFYSTSTARGPRSTFSIFCIQISFTLFACVINTSCRWWEGIVYIRFWPCYNNYFEWDSVGKNIWLCEMKKQKKSKKKKLLPFYVSNYMKRCYPNVSAIIFFPSFPWCLSRVLCFASFCMDVLFISQPFIFGSVDSKDFSDHGSSPFPLSLFPHSFLYFRFTSIITSCVT